VSASRYAGLARSRYALKYQQHLYVKSGGKCVRLLSTAERERFAQAVDSIRDGTARPLPAWVNPWTKRGA
jgi:hypothetical protein